MSATQPTDERTKGKIIADLLGGESGRLTAAKYDVHESTVSRIKSTLTAQQLQTLASEKSERLKDLLYEYISEGIITLIEHAKIVRDPEYVKQQPAGQLAVFDGVLSDKLIRLLDANQRAAETRIRELELANDARSLGEFTDTNQTGTGEDPDFNRLSDNPDREEFSRVPA